MAEEDEEQRSRTRLSDPAWDVQERIRTSHHALNDLVEVEPGPHPELGPKGLGNPRIPRSRLPEGFQASNEPHSHGTRHAEEDDGL